ncbi:Aste57867_23127 [Aphanomyces stellatus]|uniref:Aste57867_23127 protein n=1 Tax=Aphanomyces stellatus TaxID=120398 RepID=A0A485LMQ9_9STRA|nr:hypothetical protein As57867_023056 [Aphanomyces stellatus]VFT99775.1 Aste57867_23127 [Aphanomyces stellatus]
MQPPVSDLSLLEPHPGDEHRQLHTKKSKKSTKSDHGTKAAPAAASDVVRSPPPQEDATVAYSVLFVLICYIGACAYTYFCPAPSIPWEVEFAIPTSNVSSNFTATIVRPQEGEITSSPSIAFELFAPSIASNAAQVLQYTIHIDDVLVMTDLSILTPNEAVPFETESMVWTPGDHVINITLAVPLRGGVTETLHFSRRFHWVPPGTRIVKVALPPRVSTPPTIVSDDTCMALPQAHILAPHNASTYPFPAAVPLTLVAAMDVTIQLDGHDVMHLPVGGEKDVVRKGTLDGLAVGNHTVALLSGQTVLSIVSFDVVEEMQRESTLRLNGQRSLDEVSTSLIELA